MSDYANPHRNPSDESGGESNYVDFNQFVAQHNLAQQFHQAHPAQMMPVMPTNYFMPTDQVGSLPMFDQQYYPPPTFTNQYTPVDFEMVRNSNLAPTAIEFVPQQQNQPPSPVFYPPFALNHQETLPDFHQTFDTPESSSGQQVDEVAPLVQEVDTVSLEQPVTSEPVVSASQGAIRKTYQNGTESERSRASNNNGRKSGPGASGDVRAGNFDAPRFDQRRNGGSGRTASQYSGDDQRFVNKNNQDFRRDATKPDNQQRHLNQESQQRNNTQDNQQHRQINLDNQQQRQNNLTKSNNQRDDTNWNRNNPFNRASKAQGQHHPDQPSPIKQSNSSHSLYQNQSRGGSYNNNNQLHEDFNPSPKKFDKKKHPEFKPNRNLKVAATADDTSGCSQREKLIREIDAGRLECLVCCENIKPFQSTWSCTNCFHIIHLNCIVKWANSSKDEEGWRCPTCKHVTEQIPDTYWCFCGKTKTPQYNRNDVAHSCGELCGKKEGCVHPCGLLCHPGPCATCHAMVTRECGCGRTKKTMQCCQKDDTQCSEVCDKVLACGVHRCTKICHAGDCVTCEDQVEHRCHCGKDKKQMPCVAENNEVTRYSCKKMCNRHLSCKNHKCKRICHPDDCGDCLLLPANVTSCPCGKTPIPDGSRKSCTDPVPLCDSTCKRPLKCGQPSNPHTCPSKCHAGNCPPCTKETAVRCRCGHMEQMVKCRLLLTRSDDARCKKRCTKKRNCGKHKCNQECCIDIDHVCPLQCNFNLSCGKHKCDQTCHKGRCQRCYRSSFVELYCECGANVIYPPVPCGTKKPACDRPCSRQHTCNHPVMHTCHAATNCPPCMAFISIFCHGGHEERKTIPCSQGEFTCGLRCAKPLKCGRHKCIKICHSGPCEAATDVCKQSCTKLRVMCGHKCLVPCHTGDCPDTPCREQVEVLCQCGNRKAQRTCQDFATEYRRIASSKFATTMEDMQRGTSIELSDILGPLKMSNNKTLDCNEECRVLERNNRLALGLQIRNPDLAAKYAPKYTEFTKGWARKDPQLVSMIHDKLTELVKLAKQSQQKSRSHSFPTMNWEKRQLVHEICATFGIEAVAYDAEPNRNVVATAHRDTSWLPSMSVMESLKRESGQRRIPVPTNNAWGMKR